MVKLGKQRIDQTNLIKITSVNYSNNNGIRHSKMPRDKLLRPGENREIRVRASVVLKVNLSICHFLTAATKFSCCSCNKKMLFCSLSLLSAKVLETRSISFSRLRRTFNLHLLWKGRRFCHDPGLLSEKCHCMQWQLSRQPLPHYLTCLHWAHISSVETPDEMPKGMRLQQ